MGSSDSGIPNADRGTPGEETRCFGCFAFFFVLFCSGSGIVGVGKDAAVQRTAHSPMIVVHQIMRNAQLFLVFGLNIVALIMMLDSKSVILVLQGCCLLAMMTDDNER